MVITLKNYFKLTNKFFYYNGIDTFTFSTLTTLETESSTTIPSFALTTKPLPIAITSVRNSSKGDFLLSTFSSGSTTSDLSLQGKRYIL